MSTIDDLITSVLNDEARDAPSADAFINRILGEIETERAPRPKPRWDLTVPAWTVPMTAAAVAALIVLAAVMSSLWLSVDGRERGGVTTPPTTTVPSPKIDSGARDHDARLPGWVALSSGALHIEMDADDSDDVWWKNWTVGCSLSVLASVESGDFACAGQPGQEQIYEVMVDSGLEPANLNSARISIDGPLVPSVLRHGLESDFCGGSCPNSVGGTSAEVMSTTAEVRYNCPGACGKVVKRDVTVIGFTNQDAHITILSPVGESLLWLTDYVYTDPED